MENYLRRKFVNKLERTQKKALKCIVIVAVVLFPAMALKGSVSNVYSLRVSVKGMLHSQTGLVKVLVTPLEDISMSLHCSSLIQIPMTTHESKRIDALIQFDRILLPAEIDQDNFNYVIDVNRGYRYQASVFDSKNVKVKCRSLTEKENLPEDICLGSKFNRKHQRICGMLTNRSRYPILNQSGLFLGNCGCDT